MADQTQYLEDWGFDREGRIAGWERNGALVCAECADDGDGDPVTMEEAGHTSCVACGKRIA